MSLVLSDTGNSISIDNVNIDIKNEVNTDTYTQILITPNTTSTNYSSDLVIKKIADDNSNQKQTYSLNMGENNSLILMFQHENVGSTAIINMTTNMLSMGFNNSNQSSTTGIKLNGLDIIIEGTDSQGNSYEYKLPKSFGAQGDYLKMGSNGQTFWGL